MNHFEKKIGVIRSLATGEKVAILDEEKEYEPLAAALGCKLKPQDKGFLI